MTKETTKFWSYDPKTSEIFWYLVPTKYVEIELFNNTYAFSSYNEVRDSLVRHYTSEILAKSKELATWVNKLDIVNRQMKVLSKEKEWMPYKEITNVNSHDS